MVLKTFAHHAPRQNGRLGDGIEITDVMPSRKFKYVTVQVLLRYVVERSLISALEQSPK